MLSIKSLRKIDPIATANLSDEELESVCEYFYDLGQLMFEDWCEQKFGSKFPVGALTETSDNNII